MPPGLLTGVDDGSGRGPIHSLAAAVGVKRASGWRPGVCLLSIHSVSVGKPVLTRCWPG